MKLTTAGAEERRKLLEELIAIRSGRRAGQRGRPSKRGSPPRRDPSRTPKRPGTGSERGPRRCANCLRVPRTIQR